MMEDGKPCLDLAQQLHAVENAIANAKRKLIHDRIDHCVDGSGDAVVLGEMKQLTKYL